MFKRGQYSPYKWFLGTPKLPSNVLSSCVGPMPPVVMTCVNNLENNETSLEMTSKSSLITDI
jgi:hypothetical protein